jgi:NAD(P)-dependent dehydrogenase (short-subunit alcohol dehydrogenase family)/acyl carrier protein
MLEQPQLTHELMRGLVEKVSAAELQPLEYCVFELSDTVHALRRMVRAEHTGKLVIKPPGDAAEHTRDNLHFKADATYLVTGGLGGLGLELAQWLVDRGARSLLLVGRSEPSEQAQSKIQALLRTGARVECRKCDISKSQEVKALVASAAEQFPPLGGVFHLAGVLDDGVLREQNRERIDRVMAAKVLGAWNLHQATKDLGLDSFVLFSSVASLLGSPGQANYAAANAFLDSLAHERRRMNLPGLSINWGSWAEVGMAAKLEQSEGRRWASAGVGWIDPIAGMQALERILAADIGQAAVMPIDWTLFLQKIPKGSEPRWLSTVAAEARDSISAEDTGPPELIEQLHDLSSEEQLDLVRNYTVQTAMRILAWDASEPPAVTRPLSELGFDSLTAVEFCNALGRGVGQHINPTLLFDYSTIQQLSHYIASEMLDLEVGQSQGVENELPLNALEEEANEDQGLEEVADSIEQMSEDEMDAFVARQLGNLEGE